MSASPFAALSDLIGGWAEDVLNGRPPPRWPAGPGPLARFPLGPGLITLLGGPPASGKTALANQLAIDAARLNGELRVLLTCCEMPPAVLLDRTLSRLAGVPYRAIRGREVTADQRPAVAAGMATLNEIGPRVAFHTGPFDLAAVAESADGCGADLIVIDYLQRLSAPGTHKDKRSQTTAVLDVFREWTAAGKGLLVLSSVGRQPTGKHGKSSYDGLTLASFKESGDIEYAADDAFLLPPADDAGLAVLSHVKARHTEPESVPLRAELGYMRFDPADGPPTPTGGRAGLLGNARAAWAKAAAKGGGG